jgi:hypothetical protein
MKSITPHTLLSVVVTFLTVAFAIELGANSANGGTISLTIGATSSGSVPVPSAVLYLTTGASRVTFPSLEPDDFDRALNYQVGDPPSYMATIRAENAADFGFDWEEFQDSLNGVGAGAQLVFGISSPRTIAGNSTSNAIFATGLFDRRLTRWFGEFMMDEIRVSVDYYFWHPILTGLRATKISFEIDGSGRVIPEPSSLVLAVLASLAFATRRKRTSYRI